MLPSLPAHDPDPNARAARLHEARAQYRYAWDQPPGIAMAEEVPKGEGYSPAVIARTLALTAEMKVNRIAAGPPPSKQPAASTIASCRALFATISAPRVAAFDPAGEDADRAFAWQRVAGANPLLIEGVDRLPEGFPVGEDDFARAIAPGGGDTLEAARDEGRLYLASYALLDGIPAGTGAGAQKYVAAPLALFVHQRGSGLLPVAIQCAQEPGPHAPILTPRDGVAWQMARAIVQVADCAVQEIFFHLGRAHFLVEAFVIATARQLARAHPVAVLLRPHFEGTLAINDGARTKLCASGGQLEALLGPTREASLALARRAVESFRLDEALPRADLRRRRVSDPVQLGDYPYRDDALLVWAAIVGFVGDYLALYYPDDAAVASDPELRAWAEEIRSDEGGRVRSFPARFETVAALSEALSWLVFAASAQHAALNYPQFEMMAYAPNMPAAGYAPAPDRDASLDAGEAWSRMLPPRPLAADQLDFFYQQSFVRENRLGHYPPGCFEDPRAREVAARFVDQLAVAEKTIAERDARRFLPYPWLLPSNITASIHV